MKELHAMPWEQVITEAIAIIDHHGERHMITVNNATRSDLKSSASIFRLARDNGTTSEMILSAIAKKEIEKAKSDHEGDFKRMDRQLTQVATDLKRWTGPQVVLPAWVRREMETLWIEIKTLRELTGRTR